MKIITIIPLICLATGILLQLGLRRQLSNTAKGWLAFLTGVGALVAVLFLLPSVQDKNTLDYSFFNWDNNIPFVYHIDGLSLVFALLASGVGSAILLYCIQYMKHEEGVTRFYTLMLAFIAGMLNLVFSANLLLAYISWELIGLCSYFLVGFWYKNTRATQGARKVLLITHITGYAFLIAILVLYSHSGTFIWTDPQLISVFDGGVFFLILISAMAKSVMFPLHTWIPEAMNAPTPVSALLHSACYVKAGVYLIARMYSFSPWQVSWNTVVLVIGCLTMIVGALFALAQSDLKRLLAYSTISQLGYIITGLGLGTGPGIAAGVFYCLSHGLFKGTLFLCAGAVQHETGTRDMRFLGGLSRKMPGTTLIWLIVASAIIGVPLTNGFVAKWLLYDAALDAGKAPVIFIAWLVSNFTAFYILKATAGIFYGDLPAELAKKEIKDASPLMLAGMGILAAGSLLFGIFPQVLVNQVVKPAVLSLGFDWGIQVSWFGMQTDSSGIALTAGAGITLLALLTSLLIFVLLRSKSKSNTNIPVFSGGEPLPTGERVGSVDFSEYAEKVLQPFYKAADPDPLYTGFWKAILFSAQSMGKIFLHLENRPLLAGLLITILTFAVVWVW